MFLNSNKLGSAGLEAPKNPGQIPFLSQQKILEALDTSEIIDMKLLGLIEKIPYHAWGGALNMSRSTLLAAIPAANYSTLVAICQKLLNMPESYWNDNRDRDFSGIIESIENRLGILGYTIEERETRHYISNSSMKRIHIPSDFQK